uniref:G-protein coupled receptors family 1 profile domain-containing protein n=1 Tax=Oryzias melastigma TaxID=30732 RepID=A0A3B3DSM4_ORYME
MEQLNLTAVTPNISSCPGLPSPPLNSRGVLPAVVLSLCFLMGVPGNIAVIILKPKFQQLSSVTQRLILNLAVSDLLCLVTLPLWIYNLLYSWIFGLVACKIVTYVISCSVYGSLLTTTLLSFQRYMLVVHKKFYNQTKVRLLLILLWIVVMVLSIPASVVRQLTCDEQRLKCTQSSFGTQKIVVLLTETLVGFASFLIVAFSYIQIYRKVNRGAFFNNPQTSRLVTSIIVVFFVLWIPFYIVNVLRMATTVGSVTIINSCINPLLSLIQPVLRSGEQRRDSRGQRKSFH